VPLEAHSIDF